jgi:lactobin A/cerein 7B family class IIb bacteriocin
MMTYQTQMFDDVIVLQDDAIDSVAGGILPAIPVAVKVTAAVVGGTGAGFAAGYWSARDPQPSRSRSGGGRRR